MPIVQHIHHVNSVYILCQNETQYEQQRQKWTKIQGIYTDITPIYEALKKVVRDCDHNMVSISFLNSSDENLKTNLDELDRSFMYTQIMKEIILTINFEEIHINEFFTYCREQFVGNTIQLQNVDELQNEYRHHQPIWWYTYSSILYSMLNKALRTMEVDLIIQMGFFIRDLHEHIARLHSEQLNGKHSLNSFTVFRGQGLFQPDFDQLMKTIGGLISFNNFLSTSFDQEVSLAFAESNLSNPNLIGVLFEITVNPTIPSTPFGNICDISYYHAEEEILFSMHSIFRIGQIKQISGNNRLWQVKLTQTSDNDPQLHALTEYLRQETFPQAQGWYRLGQLLISMGQFDKAQELCDLLLKQRSNEGEKGHVYHMLGLIKNGQGKYEEAIGLFERSLEVKQKTLSENHPDLATSFGNIGKVYDRMGEYLKALSSHEKALEIRQKALPSNHSDLASSNRNIGRIYDAMGEYSKALSYYEKALEIRQKVLPPNHPDLANCYNSIGGLYYESHEYSKALSSYEKALEIWQKALPPNHPTLATSYNNIGLVYNQMQDYSKALSYYEKVLEIEQKTLSVNHSNLACSYNNIGLVYFSMGECSKALSYYEKALEIWQKTLSMNHSKLACSYHNIGLVYEKMSEYSKALWFLERTLEIGKCSLPENHPNLQKTRKNIERVNKKL